MKKWLSLLLVMCIALVPAMSLAIEYPIQTDKTLTLWRILDGSIVEGGYTTSNDTPAVLSWEARTGVDLEITEFADATALVLALNAASTLPDMFMLNAPANYNGGVLGLAGDGMVTELTEDMIVENAPDYWEFVNKPLYMQQIRQLDGKMYFFAGHVFEDASIFRCWRGLFYRGDILEKLGKAVPETADELYDVLKAAKEAGIPTPLIFQGKTDLKAALEVGVFTSPFGLVNTAEYQTDGVYHYGAYEPEYKDVLAYMNKLYTEGLISVDYLTMESATAQSMISTGEAVAFFGNNTRLNTFLASLEEGGAFVPGPVMRAADQERPMFNHADSMMANHDDTVYISADCKDPALCLQFMNYLFTEEGNMVRNFGEEGVSYIMVDGKPQYTELLTKNPDGYSLDGVARAHGLINWPGIHSDAQLALRHPQDTQFTAYELWSNTDHDDHVIVNTTVLGEYLDEYTNLWVDISMYIDESRAKFISGQMNLDSDFDAYISTLKSMGMDRVIEIKQVTLDAYAAAQK